MSTFQPLIPTGTVDLSVDYQNLQGNFQQLDTTFGVDHTTFSNQTAQNGYHTVVHQIPFSTTASNPPNNYPPTSPAAVPGIGELFSSQINDGFDTDEALFFKSGGGKLLQLTSNVVPLASSNGYTFLPGGLLIQWGRVSASFSGGDTGTVTFATSNKSFPNNCFGVWIAPQYTGIQPNSTTGQATVTYNVTTLSRLKFDWLFVTSSSRYTRFFWVAIGN